MALRRPGMVEHADGPPPALELKGLTKRYGTLAAVSAVDLTVGAGEVFGLLGPNGSGKSTTLNLVLGFITPTAGEVAIHGHSLRAARGEALRDVGGLVEGSAFYPYLSGRHNLRMLARLRGLPDARVEESLELVGMAGPAGRKFGDYSQGMRQRLGVAAALMHRPRLVVLDEPTSGLDPAGTREMRALLPQIAAEGATVVLASHLLSEVEQVCGRVAIMQAGRIIASGRVEDLLSRRPRWRVRVAPDERARAVDVLQPFSGAPVAVEDDDIVVETAAGGADLNRALVQAGIIASELEPLVATLESVFIELTEPEAAS